MQEIVQGQAERPVEKLNAETVNHTEEQARLERLEKLKPTNNSDSQSEAPVKESKEATEETEEADKVEAEKKELLSPKLAKYNSDLKRLESDRKEVEAKATQINEFIAEAQKNPKDFAKLARSLGVEFESPLDLAEAFGYKPEDFVLATMNGNKPDAKTIERRQQEKYYQELEDIKKAIKDKELATQEKEKQSIIEYNNRLIQQAQQSLADYLVENKDKYEVTVETYGGQGLQLVFDYLVRKYPNANINSINQHFEEAAEEVEKELTKEAEKITKLKKFQSNNLTNRSTEVKDLKPVKDNQPVAKAQSNKSSTNNANNKTLDRKDFATEEEYALALKRKLGLV